MNLENFGQYLENPSLLYQLNYQELKNLVVEYPYSANLRVLLLLKARQERDPRYADYLTRAAAHTIDRAYLYDQLHVADVAPMTEALDLTDEEVLELKSLSELAILPREITPETIDSERMLAEPVPDTASSPTPFVADEDPPETIPPAAPMVNLPEPAIASVATPGPALEAANVAAPAEPVLLGLLGWGHLMHDWASIVCAPPPPPQPKEQFANSNGTNGGIDRAELSRRLRSARQRQMATIQQKKSVTLRPVKQIALQSLADYPDLASETLAHLLVEHEQYDMALKMYERLSLKFPQKSGYFAGIIENLKQKL